jgi:outer membrane protein with beta-barrel domain
MKRLTSALMIGSVAAFVAGAPGSALAQARGYVQLGAGLAIPVGNYKDDGAKTGWVGQVAGGISSGMIGGRISGSFIRNGIEGTSEHNRLVGAMGDLVLSPKTSGKAAPYVLAGAGFQNGETSGGISNGVTKFAWNAGAGIGVAAGGIGLFLEGRFLSVRTDGGSTNLIPITVGVKLGGH